MIVEFRTYRLVPGSGAAFVELMRAKALPLLAQAGIRVLRCEGSLDSEDGHEEAILIRCFETREARREQEDAFYSGEAWVNGPRDAVLSHIESFHTVTIEVGPEAMEALVERGAS